MFQQEKITLLLSGSRPGSMATLPAALATMATDGLQRVVRPYLNDFVAIGLIKHSANPFGSKPYSVEEFDAAARGYYKQFPLAVALAKLSATPADACLDSFFGHLVMARLSYSGTNSDELDAAEYSAGLALRKFIDIGRPEVLRQVIGKDDPLDLSNHCKRLLDWKANAAAETVPIQGLRRGIEDLERFHAFLAITRTPKPGRERNKHAQQESTSLEAGDPESVPIAESPSPAKTLLLPQTSIVVVRPAPDANKQLDQGADVPSPEKPRAIISRARADEAVRHGEPAAEGVDQFEIQLANESCSITRPFALPRQRLPAGHFELRAKRTAAQDLALADPATLRYADLELLVSTLTHDAHSLVTKAVIAAALFGGQQPTKLLEWEVVATVEDLEFTTLKTVVVLVPFGLWVPVHATKRLPKASKDQLSSKAPAVFLPWNSEWRGLCALRALAERRVGKHLFTEIEMESVANIIKQLGKRQTNALTLRRICGLLIRRVRDDSEDILIGALIAGNTLNASESAGLHYFQTTVKELALYYWKHANSLHLELGGKVTNKPMPDLPISGTAGSQRCPDVEIVKTWVSTFQDRVGTPPRGRPTIRRVAAFHSLYSAYVIECLMWVSGVRPHTKGLACLEPVGSVILVDEKNKGVAALRQIPLSAQAAKQWAQYQVHRKWVMNFLGLRQCPTFFSVNDQGKVKQLTFSEVQNISECPFVANGNRHHFSTSLRRAGMTGAEVNALMGHSLLGQETGNRYGTLDLRKLFVKCTKAMDTWMAAGGWVHREGFGGG